MRQLLKSSGISKNEVLSYPENVISVLEYSPVTSLQLQISDLRHAKSIRRVITNACYLKYDDYHLYYKYYIYNVLFT